MVNKKRVGMMVAVTLLIGVLLFCSVFFLVRRANREITQRSFDELATATRQIAKDLADAANADQTILSAMAELIAGHDERDNDAVLRIMKSFSLSETFVSTVALLRPDGTLLLTDGTRYDVSGTFDFETEAARGAYISDRVTSYFAPEKLVVRNVVPVVRDGETVAILYGVVPLQEISKNYEIDLYNGNAFLLLVDGNNGDILLDTWHDSLGNLSELRGRKMLKGYMSPFDAAVVRKLAESGMVTLGKLNCDEFAMGSANENSAYGKVFNPWDPKAVPGGSSGGSASCVAAGLAPIVTATDTGGSIREPAAFTGITGVKPTYGRPSRLGMIAFASSLDTAGLMAHSVEDIAWVLGDMVGFEPWDSTSENMPAEDFTRDLEKGVKGTRIGVPRAWFAKSLDPEVASAIEKVIAEYRAQGAEIVDIDLPNADLGVSVYYVVACAEASSNLSRFDGVRYGYRAAEYEDIQDMIKKSRNEGLGAEPKRRILIGTYVLSHGYYDAYYIKAQKVRRLIAREFDQAFEKVDAILSPVTVSTAYDFGAKSDPVAAYLGDLYTVPASLAGLPCMSMPCGIHSNGRPIGVQLTCARFNEAKMLGIAQAWQNATDWHKRHPNGF